MLCYESVGGEPLNGSKFRLRKNLVDEAHKMCYDDFAAARRYNPGGQY